MDEGATGAQQPTGVPSESGAQMEGDEPFPTHMTARERRAFAEEVFDGHAAEIFRYVLAWTGDRASAAELTRGVLRGALARVEQLAEPEADVEARVVAQARAAVTRSSESAEAGGGAFTPTEPAPLLLAELGRLDDARREVLVLRQLLGYSTEHAARLLALDAPVVDELERDACATLWRRLRRAAQTQQVTSWDALTVAEALRQSAPDWLDPLDKADLAGMREQLLGELAEKDDRPAAALVAATGATGVAAVQRRGLVPTLLAFAAQRRWLLAGCVASAAIGTVAALAMGQAGQSSPCGARTCVVSTTAVAVEDTATPSPSEPEQSSGMPTTTTRASAGVAAPVNRSRPTATTARSTTTTATTMPRSSTTQTRRTTTTSQPQTTSSSVPQSSTTTSTTTNGGGG
jgi:DNA-directed RNA polymerase specialized sigma24 family protein